MIEVNQLCGQLYLGKQGENLARIVYFDEHETWMKEFGEGKCELLHQRNGDSAPYPVKLETEDGRCCWKITASDTAIVGDGKCELHYLVNDVIVKSKIWTTTVLESLSGDVVEAPEPQKAWVDDVLDAAVRAEDAAERAEEAASTGGGVVSDEQIQEAVENYLEENPVEAGATEEQAEQIQSNTEGLAQLTEGLENGDVVPQFASNAERAKHDENGSIIHETYVFAEEGKGLSSNDFTDDDKDSIHTHSNKDVLDGITQDKINKWDNNSGGSSEGKTPFSYSLTVEEDVVSITLDKNDIENIDKIGDFYMTFFFTKSQETASSSQRLQIRLNNSVNVGLITSWCHKDNNMRASLYSRCFDNFRYVQCSSQGSANTTLTVANGSNINSINQTTGELISSPKTISSLMIQSAVTTLPIPKGTVINIGGYLK